MKELVAQLDILAFNRMKGKKEEMIKQKTKSY